MCKDDHVAECDICKETNILALYCLNKDCREHSICVGCLDKCKKLDGKSYDDFTEKEKEFFASVYIDLDDEPFEYESLFENFFWCGMGYRCKTCRKCDNEYICSGCKKIKLSEYQCEACADYFCYDCADDFDSHEICKDCQTYR